MVSGHLRAHGHDRRRRSTRSSRARTTNTDAVVTGQAARRRRAASALVIPPASSTRCARCRRSTRRPRDDPRLRRRHERRRAPRARRRRARPTATRPSASASTPRPSGSTPSSSPPARGPPARTRSSIDAGGARGTTATRSATRSGRDDGPVEPYRAAASRTSATSTRSAAPPSRLRRRDGAGRCSTRTASTRSRSPPGTASPHDQLVREIQPILPEDRQVPTGAEQADGRTGRR